MSWKSADAVSFVGQGCARSEAGPVQSAPPVWDGRMAGYAGSGSRGKATIPVAHSKERTVNEAVGANGLGTSHVVVALIVIAAVAVALVNLVRRR
jgi:hypothetical protein